MTLRSYQEGEPQLGIREVADGRYDAHPRNRGDGTDREKREKYTFLLSRHNEIVDSPGAVHPASGPRRRAALSRVLRVSGW